MHNTINLESSVLVILQIKVSDQLKKYNIQIQKLHIFQLPSIFFFSPLLSL